MKFIKRTTAFLIKWFFLLSLFVFAGLGWAVLGFLVLSLGKAMREIINYDGKPKVNPATGLLMFGDVDAAGNAFGDDFLAPINNDDDIFEYFSEPAPADIDNGFMPLEINPSSGLLMIDNMDGMGNAVGEDYHIEPPEFDNYSSEDLSMDNDSFESMDDTLFSDFDQNDW